MSRTWLAGQELPRRPDAVSSAAGPEDGVEQPATAVRLLSGREVVDSALAAPWPTPGRPPQTERTKTPRHDHGAGE